jgi:hypothetical protein
MSSELIIEDGTGLADANSYVSAADARAYAALRGVTLAAAGTGIDPVEIQLVLAAQYLDSLAWVGYQATAEQGLAWPRVLTAPYLNFKFIVSCFPPSYLVPVDPSYYNVLAPKLLAAQCQLVVEQFNGVVLLPSTIGGTQFITREKVDVIETSYSEKLGTLASPAMPSVDSLLRGLLVVGGGSTAIRTVRV